jgi:hypothetical protein
LRIASSPSAAQRVRGALDQLGDSTRRAAALL